MIPIPPVILALATERQEVLWRHLLKALDLDVGALTLQCELGPGLHAERRAAVPGALLVADLAALHDDDLALPNSPPGFPANCRPCACCSRTARSSRSPQRSGPGLARMAPSI